MNFPEACGKLIFEFKGLLHQSSVFFRAAMFFGCKIHFFPDNLHTDAYAAYGAVHAAGQVKPVYCWAHARRKFIAALEGSDERARRAVEWIGRLFLVERYARAKGMDAAGVKALREAMGYLRGRWDGFRTFLLNCALSLDNNFSERQIRQVVIGRRNYFLCGSEEGARRAAVLYSLVCTCQIQGVDAWKYLAHVFAVLAEAPEADSNALTPAALKIQSA